MSAAYITGINAGQTTLLPPSIDDLITADNPIRFIKAFVGSLDLAETLSLIQNPETDYAEVGYLY